MYWRRQEEEEVQTNNDGVEKKIIWRVWSRERMNFRRCTLDLTLILVYDPEAGWIPISVNIAPFLPQFAPSRHKELYDQLQLTMAEWPAKFPSRCIFYELYRYILRGYSCSECINDMQKVIFFKLSSISILHSISILQSVPICGRVQRNESDIMVVSDFPSLFVRVCLRLRSRFFFLLRSSAVSKAGIPGVDSRIFVGFFTTFWLVLRTNCDGQKGKVG